ncbi:Druantia anti-phage system protein DruA [Alicyclobacillus acidocaldarius]|uniref:Uncharacterized protein n=1 Tax=Alicyclobacillus acidocaldarius (strain Tc-4-1) TaxID=1048834 RepID=F8IGY6_ALIAT|nr:Druantia anti-phage system protein DruA [Alicyclobacillus acidocaldarius]AEJ44340.1 hypothetical protein TC41_2441 [Alicyclobacillus acidocaldarius subsp. acidocaldarius Tc-4-1]
MTEVEKQVLRRKILDVLRRQGFYWDGRRLYFCASDKNALRALHAKACAYNIERAKRNLQRHEDELLGWIANGNEINPAIITPTLIEVKPDTVEELLFRYVRLHWSIPVSAGYGRRLRFLVWDAAHDRLIGIFGLCDPVFALADRDQWIGWSKEQRRLRLANVMDAFVLGAVPPYNHLLGGKLVALAVVSNEVREVFERRYANRITRISKKLTGPLVLVTTTSALGKSSIYNRVKYRDLLVMHSVGFTSGSGEFPYINGLYKEIITIVEQTYAPTAKHKDWGSGFRNRREVILKALKILELPQTLIYHGVAREIFVAPLAKNAPEFLRGETDVIDFFDFPFSDLASWWKERWALPRASRDNRFQLFRKETWRLWN